MQRHNALSTGVAGPVQSEEADLELVERVARLSRERFASRAARYDEESIFPAENYQDLREAGLLALNVPRAYGGLEANPLTYVLCLLEIARGCSATALTFNMHSTVLGFINAMGTEEQKRRYFREVVEEGRLIASITSEPESSFRDKFVMQTVFRPVEGGYQVSGTKIFCSLGDSADYYFLSGVLEGSTSARAGLVSALIPRTAGGITVEGRWNALGMRGTVSHTIRYESLIRPEQMIGAPGQMLTIDLSGYALGYAAVYLGIAMAAFDFSVEYAKTKSYRPGAEPICHHPLTQRTLAELGTSIRAARLLLLDAARTRMQGDHQATTLAVNQSKYFSAEVAVSVTERTLRLAGGRGILKSLPLERWHRDALAGPVMPPSNDRCLETIGKMLCGLPAATLEYQ